MVSVLSVWLLETQDLDFGFFVCLFVCFFVCFFVCLFFVCFLFVCFGFFFWGGGFLSLFPCFFLCVCLFVCLFACVCVCVTTRHQGCCLLLCCCCCGSTKLSKTIQRFPSNFNRVDLRPLPANLHFLNDYVYLPTARGIELFILKQPCRL